MSPVRTEVRIDPKLAAYAAQCDRAAGDHLPRRNQQADHATAARRLRIQYPGEWKLVATYRALKSAETMVWLIGRGAHFYTPVGAFEARALRVGMGAGLFVRFRGEVPR